jgi:hypothetical protein
MTAPLKIRDLFVTDVTRDIPPVVYFHEQNPQKVATEVSEYIITGGWPAEHPNHRRVPEGIHEQYVRLLDAISGELDTPGGPSLPTAWISGFYGSGKSSFAKLLGLALDGMALPDGLSVAEALLRRDTSPKAAELRAAWERLRKKVDPIAAVFDVGGVARDGEHVHSTAVRQVQRRLGYCTTEPLVADFELRLERDGEWARFESAAQRVLGKPWSSVKDKALAEEEFSLVMHELHPERYADPMAWFAARAGTHARRESPEEAVAAIGDMIGFRQPNATLFLVVDEVSQYVLSNKDRVDRLRAFASELGARLKGRVWLLALGQQKLDEEADDSFLVWAKDRFPPKLRVHLAATNIRDVVHKRLLQKTPAGEAQLRALFDTHRADLKLFAYGCEDVSPDEFVEVYPMLPGHIDLLLQITSALRLRSSRAQGDDQAIRGLLQLLGELFRSQHLADLDVGALVTLDRIYEVQHTALDADVQASMARVLDKCSDDATGLLVRVAKVVALLELIQDAVPTEAKLVAQCLFDRLDRGNQESTVNDALEELRRRNLIGYAPKTGYKLQSSAAEEWERERRDVGAPREAIVALVQEGLKKAIAVPERPRLMGRPFPWAAVFSDERHANDVVLLDPRDDAAVRVDFRYLSSKESAESNWVRRSAESMFENRIVWLSGDRDAVEGLCRDLFRARRMVERYRPRRESLSAARKLLLTQEENNVDDLSDALRKAVEATWMSGQIYFRGQQTSPAQESASFAVAMEKVGNSAVKDIFTRFDPIQLDPSELAQVLDTDIPNGVSRKYTLEALGLLELDAGRYVPACSGTIPRRVLEHIEHDKGVSGANLLAAFGRPPYGYAASVVKACVAVLLRASKVSIEPDGAGEITSVRDFGFRELFEKDRSFKRATIFPAGEDEIGAQGRARICKFFQEQLGHSMNREDGPIADAVAALFPGIAGRLRNVLTVLSRLPDAPEPPRELDQLQDVLERCLGSVRQTRPTVKLLKRHLDALRDGVRTLDIYHAELTEEAIDAVRTAHQVRSIELAQLQAIGVDKTDIDAARTRLGTQFDSAKPWRDIASVAPDIDTIRAAYRGERERLLRWQEGQVEAVRARLKGRAGFSTLTAEQSQHVLRPIVEAQTYTTPDAIAPSLAALRDPFLLALQRAEDDANARLDAVLSEGDGRSVVPCALSERLRHREVASEAELDALLADVRDAVLPYVRDGKRVRIT